MVDGRKEDADLLLLILLFHRQREVKSGDFEELSSNLQLFIVRRYFNYVEAPRDVLIEKEEE